MSIELRHHAKFRGDRPNHCRDIVVYGFFKMVVAAILFWFQKFLTFNGWTVQGCQTASLCQISSKSLESQPRYGDFSIFQDGGRRHLGFVIRVLGPPYKGIWWSLSLCKIWLESVQSFW